MALLVCVAVVVSEPTIRPVNPFNPEADAVALKEAMSGFGANTNKIASILGKRNNAQRLQIAAKYKASYGKDLIEKLRDELSSNFEDLAVASVRPIPELLAKELHEAIAGTGTSEDVLIEILCSFNNHGIRKIKEAYQARYNKALEADVRDDTSGLFRKVLVALLQANRDESRTVNVAQARADAQALHDAGVAHIGRDDSTFTRILTSRSLVQLRKVFEHYQTIAGKPLDEAIKSQFSGETKDALVALVRCMSDSALFYAKTLHKAMDGIGTTDKTLIRVIVTGSEFDHLAAAKTAYHQKYGRTLAADVAADTSGSYKDMLLMLIGP